MTEKMQDKLTGSMLALNPDMPPERARQKAAGVARGVAFIALGLLCVAAGFGLVIWILVQTKASPSLGLLIFAALPVLPGVYFLLAGGHIISGDAMHAAEHSGGILARTAAKALKAARGNGT